MSAFRALARLTSGAVACAAALLLCAAVLAADAAVARCGAPGDPTPFRAQNADRREVGQDLDTIRERGFIEFAVYEDFAPWSWREGGVPTGVDVAIGRIIAEALGVEPRFNLVLAGESADDDLRNHVWQGPIIGGRVSNVMLHVPWHPDFACRNELAVLTGQYFTEKLAVAWREASYPDGPPTPAYFRHDTVGVEAAGLADYYLSGFMRGQLAANIRRYSSTEAAMEALRNGSLDAVMGPLSQLEWGLQGADGLRAEAHDFVGLDTGQWTIGVAVRHTYRALGYAVDDAIQAAMADGRIQELFAAHGLSWREPAF